MAFEQEIAEKVGDGVHGGPRAAAADARADSLANPSSGAWRLDRDLPCPECEYNLRGLFGPRVDCPECGQRVDLVQLATRRWDKPWYKAPGYNFLALPAAWALVGTVGAFLFSRVASEALGPAPFVGYALVVVSLAGLIVLVVWSALLWFAYRRFGRDARAVGYALLKHVALCGYLAGIIMLAGGLIAAILASSRDAMSGVFIGCAVFVGGIALFVAARFAERAGAKFCIKKWLHQGTG